MTAIARKSLVSWLVILLYFRVSFVSFPFWVQKEMKIDHRFFFLHFSEKIKIRQIFFFSFFYVKNKWKSNIDF